MESFTFVHAADLHLDSPLVGLEQREDAPAEQIRGATRLALESLVRLCLDEEARFLLLAGDVYDGDWRDYQTGLYFVRQMARLKEAGTRVFIVRGNHDAASVITRQLVLPANVKVFSSRSARTEVLEDVGAAVHGRSYTRRTTTEDLAATYPRPLEGVFNIGLLHTSADGRPGHQTYAPCRLEALANHGYDYWALGHIHKREELLNDPWVVFPGNLQGRHARETGPKGAYLVTVKGGRAEEVEFRALDVVRWASVGVDLSDAMTPDDALETVRGQLAEEVERADGRTLAVRIRLVGATPAHSAISSDPEGFEANLSAIAEDLSPGDVWIEKLIVETRTVLDLDALRQRDDPIGGLLRGIEEIRGSPEEIAALAAVLQDLAAKVPPEARKGDDGVDLSAPEMIARLLGGIEHDLVPLLLAGDDG